MKKIIGNYIIPSHVSICVNKQHHDMMVSEAEIGVVEVQLEGVCIR